jgi:hypothetical protein
VVHPPSHRTPATVAGQQQVRFVRTNVGAFHLCL